LHSQTHCQYKDISRELLTFVGNWSYLVCYYYATIYKIILAFNSSRERIKNTRHYQYKREFLEICLLFRAIVAFGASSFLRDAFMLLMSYDF